MILAKFALQVVITSPTRPFKLVPLDSWGTVITIFGVQLETWADSELMSLAEVNQTIQMQLLPFALLLPFVAGLIVHPVESDYTHLSILMSSFPSISAEVIENLCFDLEFITMYD